MKKKCEIEACKATHYAKGLCKSHYMRFWRRGDPTSLGFYEWSPEKRLEAQLGPQDPVTGCIEWGGDHNEKGYGRLMLKGKILYAHRLAWELKNGPIPEGMKIRHTCDNPPCCNDAHLCLGTQQDNMTDMVTRGRSPRGSQRPNSKLTDNDVLEIRRRITAGERQADIADSFGISQSVVSHIKIGRIWAHIQMNKDLKLLELEERYQSLQESLGEATSQYSSECALYGDAGPGQADEIARIRSGLRELENEMNAL